MIPPLSSVLLPASSFLLPHSPFFIHPPLPPLPPLQVEAINIMTNLLKADLEVHAHLAIAAAMCEAGRLLDAGGRVVLTHLRVPYTVVELISHLIGVFTLEDEEKKAAIEEKKAALEEAALAEAEAAKVLALLSPESKQRMLDCNQSMKNIGGKLGAVVETKTEVKVDSPGNGNDGFGGGGFLGRTRKASVAVMKPSRWSKIKVKTKSKYT